MADIITYYGYTRKLNEKFQNYVCKLLCVKLYVYYNFKYHSR